MNTKTIDPKALEDLVNKAVDERVAKALEEQRTQTRDMILEHSHADRLPGQAGGAPIMPAEDEDSVLFREKYTLPVHVRVAILREKDILSNDAIARFLNEEQGETHWTGERIRCFFANKMGADWGFNHPHVAAEYRRQAELEKWTIQKPERQCASLAPQLTSLPKEVRHTSPGEVWILQAQGFSHEQIAKRLRVDPKDLAVFIERNKAYIAALSWR